MLPGGLTDKDGEAAAQLLAHGAQRPTAVTAFNDHCAAGLVAAVRSTGAPVPEDVSVVGYDDSGIASLASMALTTVAQDSATLARAAFERALARVGAVGRARGEARAGEVDEPPVETVVPPRLVVRRTTAALEPRS